MKIKIQNNCTEGYVAPAMDIVDVLVEGVLCESGVTIEDWENDDELLDFD